MRPITPALSFLMAYYVYFGRACHASMWVIVIGCFSLAVFWISNQPVGRAAQGFGNERSSKQKKARPKTLCLRD